MKLYLITLLLICSSIYGGEKAQVALASYASSSLVSSIDREQEEKKLQEAHDSFDEQAFEERVCLQEKRSKHPYRAFDQKEGQFLKLPRTKLTLEQAMERRYFFNQGEPGVGRLCVIAMDQRCTEVLYAKYLGVIESQPTYLVANYDADGSPGYAIVTDPYVGIYKKNMVYKQPKTSRCIIL